MALTQRLHRTQFLRVTRCLLTTNEIELCPFWHLLDFHILGITLARMGRIFFFAGCPILAHPPARNLQKGLGKVNGKIHLRPQIQQYPSYAEKSGNIQSESIPVGKESYLSLLVALPFKPRIGDWIWRRNEITKVTPRT